MEQLGLSLIGLVISQTRGSIVCDGLSPLVWRNAASAVRVFEFSGPSLPSTPTHNPACKLRMPLTDKDFSNAVNLLSLGGGGGGGGGGPSGAVGLLMS